MTNRERAEQLLLDLEHKINSIERVVTEISQAKSRGIAIGMEKAADIVHSRFYALSFRPIGDAMEEVSYCENAIRKEIKDLTAKELGLLSQKECRVVKVLGLTIIQIELLKDYYIENTGKDPEELG